MGSSYSIHGLDAYADVDADGAGPSHGVALATFNSGVTLSAADFLVFNTLPTVAVHGSPDVVPERADVHVAFTIDLSAPTNGDVLLTCSTVDGTAHAGSDFVGVSHGQVRIPAGSTSATNLSKSRRPVRWPICFRSKAAV